MFDSLLSIWNFAYLDPSTGSIVIQSLIGIIAGVSVFGRNAIQQIVAKTRRVFNKGGAKTEAETERR